MLVIVALFSHPRPMAFRRRSLFASLSLVVASCGDGGGALDAGRDASMDARAASDGGDETIDGGASDGGERDGGEVDADTGAPDLDAADLDAGRDAARSDAGSPDATFWFIDGALDPDGAAEETDAAVIDDVGPIDAARVDAGPPDVGTFDSGFPGCPLVLASPTPGIYESRLPTIGFGGIREETRDGHTDVFLSSPLAVPRLEVGVRLDWGGTIVFYGIAGSPSTNVIDATDTGRELRLAVFDESRRRQGCARDASCLTSPGSSCGPSFTYEGWSPVQTVDECNRGQRATYRRVDDTLVVTYTPLQSNPDWDATDCRRTSCGGDGRRADITYELRIRFVDARVVEVLASVTNREDLVHPSALQAFPIVYAANGVGTPDLAELLDASGRRITFAGAPVDGVRSEDVVSTAPWVQLQNAARTYGLGIAMPSGTRRFLARTGTAPYIHSVQPRLEFPVGRMTSVHAASYLALGGQSDVDAALRSAIDRTAPWGFVDLPMASETFTPGVPLVVAGWVFDDEPVARLEIEIDGISYGTFAVNAERADVCSIITGYAACPNVGYVHQLDTSSLSRCPHVVRVTAVDARGHRGVLGERIITPAVP